MKLTKADRGDGDHCAHPGGLLLDAFAGAVRGRLAEDDSPPRGGRTRLHGLSRAGLPVRSPAASSALYGSPPTSPTPIRYNAIGVTVAGDPSRSAAATTTRCRWEISTASQETFSITDIAVGHKYRLHVQFGYSSPPLQVYAEGVSDEFEIPPGGVLDLPIELYYPYSP